MDQTRTHENGDQLRGNPILGRQYKKWGDGKLQWTLRHMRWNRAEEIADRLWQVAGAELRRSTFERSPDPEDSDIQP